MKTNWGWYWDAVWRWLNKLRCSNVWTISVCVFLSFIFAVPLFHSFFPSFDRKQFSCVCGKSCTHIEYVKIIVRTLDTAATFMLFHMDGGENGNDRIFDMHAHELCVWLDFTSVSHTKKKKENNLCIQYDATIKTKHQVKVQHHNDYRFRFWWYFCSITIVVLCLYSIFGIHIARVFFVVIVILRYSI